MKYFFLKTLGDLTRGYCLLDAPPKGLGLAYQRMSRGKAVGAIYPADARTAMSDDHRGSKVPDIVGNTHRYLIASETAKSAIAETTTGPIEYLPLSIYNHKGRRVQGAYFIVNPIGSLDCLNHGASDIEYLDAPGDDWHGAVVGVNRFVLDPRKLTHAPSLFRIAEAQDRYVVDERLVAAFAARGVTNAVLEEIAQAT